MDNSLMKFYILANGMGRSGTMGGSIRIFLEFTKRWVKKFNITIITHEEGIKTCHDYNLKDAEFHQVHFASKYIRVPKSANFASVLFNIVKSIEATVSLYFLLNSDRKKSNDVSLAVYSATDSWPDALPAAIMKLIFKDKIKWIAGFWLFAPYPFSKESAYYKKNFFRGLLFYFYQIPVYALVNKYADIVFVTNELDAEKFITKNRKISRVLVIRGGVDTKLPKKVPEQDFKEFGGVFIGRLHLQKGVEQLIDIWKRVTEQKPNIKLAIIGNGPLEEYLREKIRKYGLVNNIKLFGFKDGIEKIKIFKSSKIVLHPTIFDSGGMAACEAMSCGLPGVSFDLPALKTYYQKGMIKTPPYDLEAFANNILKLLDDETLYATISKDAFEWAQLWDWDKRTEEIYAQLQKNW